MKTVGATGVALSTALAGCSGGGDGGDGGDGGSGGDGGDGDDGGDGGSDGGDGGSGGDGGDGGDGGGQTTEISFTTVPVGLPQGLIVQHLRDSDILANTFGSHGYDLTVNQTFDDATLFAAGQSDLSGVSYFEGARMAVEQDMDLVVFGNVLSVVHGMYVATGSEFDPDNSGGVQASLDRMVDQGARVGIQSWASGNIPLQQRIMDQVYGYDFSEGGDFNVFTTEYPTMPQLLQQGELALASTTPIVSGAPELVANDIKPLFYVRNVYGREGWGNPPLNNLTTRREFLEQEPQAVKDLLSAWQQATDWLYDSPEEIASTESGQEMLNMENEAQAQFLIDLYLTQDGNINYSTIPEEPGYTESEVESANQFLEEAEQLGQVPSGWSDRIEFMTTSEIDNLI